MSEAYAALPLDLRDGVKVTTDAGWFLVRGSNTEPIIRLVAEGPTEEGARALIDDVRAHVLEAVGG